MIPEEDVFFNWTPRPTPPGSTIIYLSMNHQAGWVAWSRTDVLRLPRNWIVMGQ